MKKIKNAACIITSIFICFILLWMAQCILVPKYQTGITEGSMIQEYYDSNMPHEVLFIGDCEVYENFSTVEMYREYGISSYIRGSAQQLTWQSYYLLEDTLRYETPKVVVFNVLALKYNEPQKEAYNRMTIDGMRWSPSKWNSIQASMLPDENAIDYLFPILRYHTRWSSLKPEDFTYAFRHNVNTFNGYYMRVDIQPERHFPPAPALMDYSLGKNAMAWLENISDLCEENGIALVLIKAPTMYPYWYPEWDDQVAQFAQMHHVPYINFQHLRPGIGLDMRVDTYDGGLHLNLSGAEKMARYFGAYLDENYDLTDYREVPEVAQLWEIEIQSYEELAAAQYAELERYGELRSWGINAVS